MKIYLMQHGEALEKDQDPDRPLSADGIAAVKRVAAFLAKSGVHIPQIWHSGKTRAAQTAAILFETLGSDGTCEAHSGLAPKDPPELAGRNLEKQSRDTAVVGHLPQLAFIAGYLLAADPARPCIAFQRGAVACLEHDRSGTWQVAWMVTPHLLAGTPAPRSGRSMAP